MALIVSVIYRELTIPVAWRIKCVRHRLFDDIQHHVSSVVGSFMAKINETATECRPRAGAA